MTAERWFLCLINLAHGAFKDGHVVDVHVHATPKKDKAPKKLSHENYNRVSTLNTNWIPTVSPFLGGCHFVGECKRERDGQGDGLCKNVRNTKWA